jgi:membrane protein
LAASADWWAILRDAGAGIARSNVSMMAAAVAFYGFLSIFPGLSMLISLYALFLDPSKVQRLLGSLAGVLPREAIELLSLPLFSLIRAGPGKLGLAFLVSLAFGLWSAMSGTGMLMQALAIVRGGRDDRGVVEFYLGAAALTAGLILFGTVSLLLIAVLPVVLDLLPLSATWVEVARLARWPVLAGLSVVGLAIIYRYGSRRDGGHSHGVSLGAIIATIAWVTASAGFSFYVARFASYDKTYGSLGAVVVLLMWLYLSAFIVLAGAALDSAIERRAERHRVK